MKTKKQTQEVLPWTNGELETLLQGLISHGTETAKVDFKAEIKLTTPEEKSELLKDISAIANTYDENYDDYGFLVYGVSAKSIVGITQTEQDTDKFQNTIEQLLKSNLSPMPQIYVVGFKTASGQKWGAIVIPPRNYKPHMFFKDFSCPTNSSKSRKKGEWFVRRGSTTDPGLPEDLAIINQKQTELLLEPLKESIRTLQSRVAKTEDQYNSALFKLVERAVSAIPDKTPQKSDDIQIEVSDTVDVGESLGMDLPTRIKHKLRTPKNEIAEDLIAEAKILQEYLTGPDTGLTWTPQLQDPERNKKIISDLEEKTQYLQLSIANIVLSDSKGEYTDALLRSIKVLAKAGDVPSGTQYNQIGTALRYYPLLLLLYTIFICGVAANRGSVLKQVLEIPIKHQRRNATSPITDVYFFSYQAKALVNDAYNQRWCEPLAQRMRQVLTDKVAEMITEFSEPEYFFRGEFVLALTNIDKSISQGEQVDHIVPLGGLYLYMHEAHDPIVDFIAENPDWFAELYSHPLDQILDMFDKNAHKMAGSGCIAIGMRGIKTVQAYQEALNIKNKK